MDLLEGMQWERQDPSADLAVGSSSQNFAKQVGPSFHSICSPFSSTHFRQEGGLDLSLGSLLPLVSDWSKSGISLHFLPQSMALPKLNFAD